MGHGLLTLSSYLGIPALFRFFHKRRLTILLYHGVTSERGTGIFNYRGKFIHSAHFEKQMRYFKHHYTIMGLDEAVEKSRTGTLPPRALAVTFDDGYRNFYTHAFPILKELDIPATMFLTTDFVFNKKPLWVDRLEYALGKRAGTAVEKAALDANLRNELKKIPSDERETRLKKIESESPTILSDFIGERVVYEPLLIREIQEMMRHKITFGAHTKSHPILPLESNDHIREEIGESKKALESRGIPCSKIFAYPNGQPGDWDDKVASTLRDLGFTAALTTVEGTNSKNTGVFEMRRMVMDGSDDSMTFAAMASGVRLFLRSIKNYAK